MILNNDTLVSENLIGELLKVAQKDEKVGIVVPKIFFAAGYEFHKKLYQKNDLGRVIWYAGGRTDWQNMFGVHLGVDEVDARLLPFVGLTQPKRRLEDVVLSDETMRRLIKLVTRSKRESIVSYFQGSQAITHCLYTIILSGKVIC